ncbi:MAG: tyrosine-type recombinase/integrase [Methanosarcinales archaeon]
MTPEDYLSLVPKKNHELASNYLKFLKMKHSRPNTILNKMRTVSTFLQYIDKKSVEKVSLTDIESWLMTKDLKSHTIKVYLTRLSSFFQYLSNRGYISQNPAKVLSSEIGAVKRNNKNRVLSIEDVRKILKSTIHPRNRAIILTLAKTGLRRAEISYLRLQDVNFDAMTILATNRKGGKETLLPMDTELANTLKLWIHFRRSESDALFVTQDGKPLEPTSVSSIVSRASARAGLNDVHAHLFRYFFTTILATNRCLPAVIEYLRGDTPQSMTGYYTQLEFTTIRREYLNAMPPLLS